MRTYVLRRLFQIVPLLLGISALTFVLLQLAPGDFLVVFASNKDRRIPGAVLHTNFSLRQEGEYLALVRPDGYVAWVGDRTLAGLIDALTTWFGPPAVS